MEEWRPVVGWPAYEVSSEGRVRSLDRTLLVLHSGDGRNRRHARSRAGRLLPPNSHKNGYLTITLYPGRKTRTVNRLVCEAFHGAPPTSDAHADHFPDPSRANNRAANLRWLSPKANRATRRFARGERNGAALLRTDDVREIRRRSAAGETHGTLATAFFVSAGQIENVVNRKHWKHVT